VILLPKEKLILLPFITGLLLIFYSWYISYPLTIDSPSDFLFNHISPFYWLGLSIVFATLYVMGLLFERNSLKCIAVAGIIIFMYSSAYFYWFIPGPDSTNVRGLTEYFAETGDLDPSKPYHSYYQWPLFFVLSKMTYTLGLDLRCFEFILFGLLGFLYATSLYSIFHKFSKDGAYLAVISYFILMARYFNYQFAPFSLGIGLLFILLMLDTRENKTRATVLTTLIIFTSMALTHAFLPVFFIAYVFIKYIISRDREYISLFLITSIIYSIVLMVQAVIFFPMAIEQLLGLHSTVYVRFAETFITQTMTPLDQLSQIIGGTILIVTALVAGSGFFILLLKRKLGHTNFALFLSGTIYAIASALLPILGVRAFAIVGIPVSLGITYFQKTRFKMHFQCLFLVIITLFTFVPLRSSYSLTKSQITFQTRDNYQCTNFLISYYDPNERSLIGTDFRTAWYLVTKIRSPNATFGGDFYTIFNREIDDYDCILFTIALEKSFLRNNYTAESIIQEINEHSIIYNSGRSYILVKKG
jgi:hypothetical protein